MRCARFAAGGEILQTSALHSINNGYYFLVIPQILSQIFGVCHFCSHLPFISVIHGLLTYVFSVFLYSSFLHLLPQPQPFL